MALAADSESLTPSKCQAWFCTTGLPSDVIIEVDDMTFHLHKFPLMSKSKKLNDLIAEQEAKQAPVTSLKNIETEKDKETDLVGNDEKSPKEGEDDDEELSTDQQQCHLTLRSFPGGPETFEMAAKFCYGFKIDLTANKVALLRCAGEALEMTEEYSEDNLISKTERFFTQSVLNNIKNSIMALKSCERLPPLAENLRLVQRCIDAISAKAALQDPTLFGWPVNDVAPACNSRRKSASAAGVVSPLNVRDPWVENLAQLNSEFFNRVISVMREKELNPEIIESCLIHYAKRCFPGLTRSNRKTPSTSIPSEAEQRELLATIVSNFPPEKSSRSPAVMRYLFGLLRTANILSASEACKSALEKKIGAKLEQATLDDLLIPSYSYLNETLYDVDCVQRILNHFLNNYEERETAGERTDKSPRNMRSAIMLVGKLIDGYLSEIASDANLKPEKFFELTMSLPEQARLYDDGVYRAVDVYLKAHPWITELEREKISGVLDCQKLTLEACTHAAQNERLPLRAVVQVLFFEQLQLRQAIAGTLITAGAGNCTPLSHGTSDGGGRGSEWREAMRENQVLRLDMDSMRTRVQELEKECSTMKKVIGKIDEIGSSQNERSWRSLVARKLGCKFKTQICDSHQSAAVADARKGRNHDHRDQR